MYGNSKKCSKVNLFPPFGSQERGGYPLPPSSGSTIDRFSSLDVIDKYRQIGFQFYLLVKMTTNLKYALLLLATFLLSSCSSSLSASCMRGLQEHLLNTQTVLISLVLSLSYEGHD